VIDLLFAYQYNELKIQGNIMQAIILAAGIGKRLLPLTKNKPKAMVKLLGKPILEYTLEALSRRKVSEIIIVVGYCKDNIIKYFGDNYRGVKIKYVENKDYETTNNIYSLKLGLKHITEDLILCEGDIVFDPKILDAIDEKSHKNLIFAGKYEPCMSGTVITLDKETKTINEMVLGSKQHGGYDYTNAYKTINVYYLSYEFLKKDFLKTLDLYLSKSTMTSYYEVIIGVILYLGNKELYAYEVKNTDWFEIDDEYDLEMAEYLFSKNKHELIGKLHGGYWRHKFLDFSYLYNQYFPNEQFYSKLAGSLSALIGNYPSGHSKLCKLLSRFYKEDAFKEENMIIGNGASELIRIINKVITKKITIPIPTFNEYENRLSKNKINYFTLPESDKFNLVKENFVKSVKKSKTNVALIINPNNPTGGIIGKDDLIWIIEKLKGTTVLVDESFIDFSGNRDKFSVQSLINKYPSLILIRSLSKEFGIPGLRIGYMVTSNKKIKDKMLEYMPIWNINSIAEYFIENFVKYESSYHESIRRVIKDRKEFYDGLTKISYLKPLPSYANFILCKVLKRSAPGLTKELFNGFNILIKDCANKKPIERNNYVRIAVRTKEDNKKLIAALKKLDK